MRIIDNIDGNLSKFDLTSFKNVIRNLIEKFITKVDYTKKLKNFNFTKYKLMLLKRIILYDNINIYGNIVLVLKECLPKTLRLNLVSF